MEQFTQAQIDALSKMVAPDRFSTGQSNRELHIKDISPHRGELPAGIIWPDEADQGPDRSQGPDESGEDVSVGLYQVFHGVPGERKVQVENGSLLSGLAGQVLDGDPHHRRLAHSFVDIGIPGKTGQLKKEFINRG